MLVLKKQAEIYGNGERACCRRGWWPVDDGPFDYNSLLMKPGTGKKVLVAMSGGVDSAVAAALLKEDGYDVVGCFMRLGGEASFGPAGEESDEHPEGRARVGHQGCCSLNDACDARLVAAMLDVPLYILNFKRDFGRIIDYFVDEYNAGRTPNPCVRCNDWLKFGKLADYARSLDAEYVATGHYARIDHVGPRPRLLRGVDANKDQSYVLFGTKADMLQHMLLPIGTYRKPQIREIARERNLPVFDKPDSQEICFVPDNDYVKLLERKGPTDFRRGDVVDRQGNKLGEHEGHQRFTVGQRRGLGVSLGRPVYVVDKDPASNTVTVGGPDDLLADGLVARDANWLRPSAFAEPLRCEVKVRYNSPPVPAAVQGRGDGTMKVRFDDPQRAIAPGQAIVCYEGDELIAGGWIDHGWRA